MELNSYNGTVIQIKTNWDRHQCLIFWKSQSVVTLAAEMIFAGVSGRLKAASGHDQSNEFQTLSMYWTHLIFSKLLWVKINSAWAVQNPVSMIGENADESRWPRARAVWAEPWSRYWWDFVVPDFYTQESFLLLPDVKAMLPVPDVTDAGFLALVLTGSEPAATIGTKGQHFFNGKQKHTGTSPVPAPEPAWWKSPVNVPLHSYTV